VNPELRELLGRARERLEELWVELQVDYEKREYALYLAAGAASLLALIPARRQEERRARLLGRAIAEALKEGGTAR
jgi:hypothetical protein